MLPALVSFITEDERTSGLSGTHLNLGEVALLPAQSELKGKFSLKIGETVGSSVNWWFGYCCFLLLEGAREQVIPPPKSDCGFHFLC